MHKPLRNLFLVINHNTFHLTSTTINQVRAELILLQAINPVTL